MDPDIKDRILDRPRARELARQGLPDPSLREMRRKYGGAGVSDEDLLLRWIVSREEVEIMRQAAPPDEYLTATQPLVTLIRELTKRTECSRIDIRKPGFSVTLARRP